MPIAYHKFIDEKFKSSPDLQKMHLNIEEHRNHYIFTKGFSEWFESLRGHSIDHELTGSIANTFLRYGKRSQSTLPNVFASISREHDLEFPEIEGMTVRSHRRVQKGGERT